MGRGTLFMLNSIPIAILVGTALGFLSGLGVGGGSLLILWLTAILGTEPQIARGINLLFFIPSSVIVSLFRWRQGKLRAVVVVPAILVGCITAAIFSWLSTIIDTGLLKKLFGGLLILTGLRELFYRPRKAK